MSENPGTPGAPQPPGPQQPYQQGPVPGGQAQNQLPYPPGYQPGYQGGYPQSNYPPPQSPGQSNGLAIAALVLGIVAVPLAFIPFFGLVSVLLGIAAIVCGGIALARKGSSKPMPIIGGALGLLGMVISIVVTVITIIALTAAVHSTVDKFPSNFPSGFPSEISQQHQFKIVVTSTAESLVSFSAGTESGSKVTFKGNWEKEFTAKTFLGMATVSVTSVNPSASNQVSCEIFIDGKSVDKGSDTGSVSCIGTAEK
ncbi:hypothetical protein FHU41_000800 [Psychromicrobium silvestre]|uniref:DUF4190 domain-containing protein n=1 Tax=Psychromicrobium silvestre TaxID=1645614 RepID=A0A7Y9S4T8_9MICC|nr:DUF4190 domain-containing protein [Psychromicrobium silvestre]NYE94579.1 hypothetical protein [Psychromicrobium silvestre]